MHESDTDRVSRCAQLAVLVDLEARWENLRASRNTTTPSTLVELLGNQRAYEAFHSKLVTYNKRYTPIHVPELLLNTPLRLGPWCKKMAAVFAGLDGGVSFPTHLLDKAYRWADGIASKRGWQRPGRPASEEPRSAVRELEELARWCEELTRANAAA